MKRHQFLLLRCILAVVLISAATASTAAAESDGLSTTEFVSLIRDFSEEGGYFLLDNFTSSEDSYLTIVDKMKELGATDSAYIGEDHRPSATHRYRFG